MRHDEYYGNSYALYNIETRKLARLTASLYTLLHLFYTNARAYEDVKNSLAEQGVHLKWDNVSQIEKEFGFRNFARHLGERIGVAIDARWYNNFANRHL